MIPEGVNPKIKKLLKDSRFLSDEELDTSINLGVLAVHASAFQELIGRKFGTKGLVILDNFFQSFIGTYSHIAVNNDTANSEIAIRLCSPSISENMDGIDGVELSYEFVPTKRRYHVYLFKITNFRGTPAKNLVKEFILE